MAQPTPYNRQFNFQDQQAQTPTAPLPAAQVDGEFNAVKVTIDQTLVNLAKIQRDDGALKNGSVGRDQLAPSLSIGFTLRGPWALATNYVAGDGVTYGDSFYRALVANLSTNLNRPDVDAVTWEEVADFAVISADAAASAAAALASENAAAASATAADASADAAAASAVAADGSADAAAASASDAATSAATAATLIGGTVTEAVRHDVAQGLAAGPQLQARQNIGITAAGSTLVTAANAAAQRTALGSTTVGDALFTAADAAAARSTLGVAVVTRAYAELTTSLGIAGTIPQDTSIPQIGEGTFVMSVPIVVKSATNRLRIRFNGFGGAGGAATTVIVTAFVGGAANAVGASAASTAAAGFFTNVSLETEVVAGATGSLTVEIRAGSGSFAFGGIGGTSAYFGTAGKTTLVVEEIVP